MTDQPGDQRHGDAAKGAVFEDDIDLDAAGHERHFPCRAVGTARDLRAFAFEVIGLGLFLAHLAGKIGWIEPQVESGVGLVPMIVGFLLINSRRMPPELVTPEQQERNKRTLVITVIAGAIIFGVVTLIELTGAN